jgi:hypothetical protein
MQAVALSEMAAVPAAVVVVTSYPEAGRVDLRRNILGNLFSAQRFGSNLT